MSKREILRRLEAVEAQLAQRPERPLPGQEAIPVATIGHHAYTGPGACHTEFFGETCGEHRDAHQFVQDGQP